MRTSCKLAAILALSALAACETTTTGPRDPDKPKPPPVSDGVEGRAIKVTYFRYTENPKTHRLEPQYYVMLSRGWKLRYGPWAKEPFEKLVKSPFKGVEILDAHLEEVVAAMNGKGWDKLASFPLESIDQGALLRMDRMARQDTLSATQSRYLTVQVDNVKKTVYWKDILLTADESITRIFAACELIALKAGMQHTVQVSVETTPIIPK
jgi:hypothetical protein